jgi:hypothetical protein
MRAWIHQWVEEVAGDRKRARIIVLFACVLALESADLSWGRLSADERTGSAPAPLRDGRPADTARRTHGYTGATGRPGTGGTCEKNAVA